MSVIDFEQYRRRKATNDKNADDDLRETVRVTQATTLRELAEMIGVDDSRSDAQAALIAETVVRMFNPPPFDLAFNVHVESGDQWQDAFSAELRRYATEVANRVKEHCALEFIAVANHLCLPIPLR